MEQILLLTKEYSKNRHLEMIQRVSNNVMDELELLYDTTWEINKHIAPYEILTQLMDCYYCLPERPDLASLFCWQAINNSYNQYLLSDGNFLRLSDTKGIDVLLKHIHLRYGKYGVYLDKYYDKISTKSYHYAASYILKGHVIKKAGFADKYASSSYTTFVKKFKNLYNVIADSYGKAYEQVTAPGLNGNFVKLNISNCDKSRKIIYSLALKLKNLMTGMSVNITLKNATSQTTSVILTDKERLEFLVYCILYASRCNNFHGSVASRLNSRYADQESYITYMTIFLVEYIILAISLNERGILSGNELLRMKRNESLMM